MSSIYSKVLASLALGAGLLVLPAAGRAAPPPGGGGSPGDRAPDPRAVVGAAIHEMRVTAEHTCVLINAATAEAVQRITSLRLHHASADVIAAARDAAIARVHSLATDGAARIEHARSAALARLATMDDATDADAAAVNSAAAALTDRVNACRDHARTLIDTAVTRTLPAPGSGGPRP